MSNCTSAGTFWLAGEEKQIWRVTTDGGHPAATPLAMPPQYNSIAVVGVLADPRGWLWLGTDSGLLAWNGSAWRNFTQESGLIWNDVNSDGLALGPDGSIWIGTSAGLGRIAYPEPLFDTPGPRVSMVGVRRDDKSVSMAEPLAWSRGDLSFHFAAPSALDRSKLIFRYRLPPLQTAWTETRDGAAHFVALPWGKYTFEVTAFNGVNGGREPDVFGGLGGCWLSVLGFVRCPGGVAVVHRGDPPP